MIIMYNDIMQKKHYHFFYYIFQIYFFLLFYSILLSFIFIFKTFYFFIWYIYIHLEEWPVYFFIISHTEINKLSYLPIDRYFFKKNN